jgi:hypothetical protein
VWANIQVLVVWMVVVVVVVVNTPTQMGVHTAGDTVDCGCWASTMTKDTSTVHMQAAQHHHVAKPPPALTWCCTCCTEAAWRRPAYPAATATPRPPPPPPLPIRPPRPCIQLLLGGCQLGLQLLLTTHVGGLAPLHFCCHVRLLGLWFMVVVCV